MSCFYEYSVASGSPQHSKPPYLGIENSNKSQSASPTSETTVHEDGATIELIEEMNTGPRRYRNRRRRGQLGLSLFSSRMLGHGRKWHGSPRLFPTPSQRLATTFVGSRTRTSNSVTQDPAVIQSSASPAFTGTLELTLLLGCNLLRVACWTYQTASISEGSGCRGPEIIALNG